jgi:GNAT superfamily N-acetyltransferase
LFKLRTIKNITKPLSEKALNACAMLYMSGFNESPWDVYNYSFTAKSARNEFTRLASAVLNSGGALILLSDQGITAGFSIVTNLGIFVKELKNIDEYRRLPKKYHNPGQYFDILSELLKIPLGKFETIGYIADVVVDKKYRGQGYGRVLIRSSLEYLKSTGVKCALAWTVNSAMTNIMSKEGFERIDGIGLKGEGIDFTVRNGVWYPTLVIPAKEIQAATSVIAQHYFKRL